MRLVTSIVLFVVVPVFLMAQSSPCRVALKAGLTNDHLKLFYTGTVRADSISIADLTNIRRASIDSMISQYSGGYNSTFIRLLSIDSTHILTPSADMFYQDSLVCSISAKWHWVDTVKGVKSATNLSKLPNQGKGLGSKPFEFKWERGVKPFIEIDVPKIASVGDTIEVEVNANFPLSGLEQELLSPTLEYLRTKRTQKNISMINGKTEYAYAILLQYKVTGTGTTAFEPLKFKVAKKKAKIPKVGIMVSE